MASERIIQLSPNFTLSLRERRIKSTRNNQEYDFDDEIASTLVFQDRMQGWFFTPALELLNNNYAMASVHLVTPLIEALGVYENGCQSKSGSDFKNQAKVIFRSLCKKENTPFKKQRQCDFCSPHNRVLCQEAIKFLYDGVRCGFVHKGFLQDEDQTKQRNIVISLERNSAPIIFESDCLTIYAHPYVESIQKAFEEFYEKLETDKEARDKFLSVWKLHWNMKRNSFGYVRE